MNFKLTEKMSIWDYLQQVEKPIVLYGMGDGADKILAICAEKGIIICDIFASDEFVRGHSFQGYQVLSLTQVREKHGDFIVLLAFAAFREDLLYKIETLAQEFEVLAPDLPLFGTGTMEMEYIEQNQDKLNQVYQLLEDEQSRLVFCDIINFKVSGKLSYLSHCTTPREEVLGNILTFGTEEEIMDLGAYDGDTIAEVLLHTKGAYQKIIAVEPDVKNFKKLSDFVIANNLEAELHNIGIWSGSNTLYFNSCGGRNAALLSTGKIAIPVKSVDEILDGRSIGFIKYDVEGAEREALLGATKTIQTYQPKLIVAAYHRNEDLITLALLIKQLCPTYRLFLRHHPYIPAWETNFYVTI